MNFLLSTFRAYFNTVGRVAPRPASYMAYKLFCTPRLKPVVRPEFREAVARATRIEVEANGHTLKGFQWGADEAPKTALLLHGWESRAARMAVLLPVLEKHGYRAIALDAPAHGESNGDIIHIPLYGATVAELMAKYRPQLVAGHSMGAMAAVYAMAHHRAGESIERLFLIASASEPAWMIENAASLLKLPNRVKKAFIERLERLTGFPANECDLVDYVRRNTPRVPAVFVHADNDRIARLSGVEAAISIWPTASLVPANGLGHNKIVGAAITLQALEGLLEQPVGSVSEP